MQKLPPSSLSAGWCSSRPACRIGPVFDGRAGRPRAQHGARLVLRLRLAIHSTVAVAAVPIVLIWIYLGRRMLVFENRIPALLTVWLGTSERGSHPTWRKSMVAHKSTNERW